MKGKMPRIDPDALYTTEQMARFLMQMEPELTFEQAHKTILDAIDSGELRPAGYLSPR